MLAEISLPAGTTKMTVREIPYLLSKAIHPDVPETTQKIVSYLHKQSADNMAILAARTEDLTDDEWAMLHAIWHHLPPFRLGMTESEWVQYAEAFQNANHRPEWGLMVYWRNLETEAAILQIDAEEQHKILLNTAISNCEITPFNHAQVPCPNYAGEALMNAFITVEDFRNYALRFNVSLLIKGVINEKRPAQLSKSAEPISPIRGSYRPRASNNDREPRWEKWCSMVEVELWQAVALSLNIEPDKVKTNPEAWMGLDHPFDEGDTFKDRLAVIKQDSCNTIYFPTPCKINMAKWYRNGIHLNEFAAWCVQVGYDIPSELAAMAQFVQVIINYKAPKTEASTAKSQCNLKETWIKEARKQGLVYIDAWRKAGYEATTTDIGLYIEGVFSTNGIYNTRGNVIDRTTIVREALTGITKHKAGHKSRLPKIPDGEAGKLPSIY